MLYFTSRDVNQSMLDFFYLVDSQLILMLMLESLNLIISGIHCWAVKMKAVIKRCVVESLLSCSLTVARTMCQSDVLLKIKLSSATCLMAVNIC